MNGMLNWLIKMLLDRSHKHCKNHSSGPILFIWKPECLVVLYFCASDLHVYLFPFSMMPHMHIYIYITNICTDSQINLHHHHHKYSLKVLLENPKIPSQSISSYLLRKKRRIYSLIYLDSYLL